MGTTTLSSQHSGTVPTALRTGVALAATDAVFYALCTLALLAAPGPFLNFMNGLFHGMDFSTLIRPSPFSWPGFLEALVVMTVWGFLAGTFFGWLRDLLGD
jgi:hypothetical protein